MLKLNIILYSCLLCGCISVYGPMKTGTQDSQTAQNAQSRQPGMSDSPSAVQIGNRKPDELINAVELYYQQKGLNAAVKNSEMGIVAAVGSDDELSGLFLDCSTLEQSQNIKRQYRIVTQVWSAGEGSLVSFSVTGIAGLTMADGNDKVKPVACKSTGMFEKDLLERLRQ